MLVGKYLLLCRKPKHMLRNFTLIILCVLMAGAAQAQRLLTEDFNYAVGQLTDSAGGANVSGGKWTPNSGSAFFIQVVAGDLSYTNYNTNPDGSSGKILMDSVKSSAEDAFTSFTAQTSGTVYTSFLINLETANNLIAHDSAIGEYFAAYLPSTSGSSYSGRVYIRKGSVANTFNLGICPSTASVSLPISWVSADFAISITHLVTFSYEIISGGTNDVVKIWVDEPVSGTEPSAQASGVYSIGSEPTNIGRFAIRQAGASKGGTPKCAIDAIKVSTSWADGTLPLTISAFNVIDNNGHAGLSWVTCNEINVNHFVVERSADAQQFTAVTTVPAKNANCATTYKVTDAKLLSGTAYYRIKSVDNDGAAKYSGIVSINGKAVVSINVFPNPVANTLVMMHPKAINGASLQVISLDGKPLLQRSIQQDAIQTSVDVSRLPKANYIVLFTNGNTKQTLRFVKQ
jgi:hypothetical protein